MMKSPRLRSALLALLLLVLHAVFCLPATAQEEPEEPAKPEAAAQARLTEEELQARIKQIEEAEDLGDEEKQKRKALYQQAITNLQQAKKFEAEAARLQQETKAAPGKLEEMKQQLAQPAEEPKPDVPEEATLQQLTQRHDRAETELKDAQKALEELQQVPQRRLERRREIRERLPEAQAELEKAKQELAQLKEEPPEGLEAIPAQRSILRTRIRSLEAEIGKLNGELAHYDATTELIAARRDMATRRKAQAQELAAKWQEIVAERRRKEGEEAARQAQRAQARAAKLPERVQEIAEQNSKLAERRTGPDGLAARIEQLTQRSERIAQQLARLKEDFKTSKEKIKAAGLTHAVGVYLRNKRAELPEIREHRRNVRARQEVMAQAQLDFLTLQEQRADLANLQSEVDEVMAGISLKLTEEEREHVREEVRKLLESQRTLLDSLISDMDTYITDLVELDTNERQLIQAARDYRAFIDERILWFKSAEPLKPADAVRTLQAAQWLLNPQNWAGLLTALGKDFLRTPVPYVLAVLIFLILLLLRRRVRSRLKSVAEKVVHPQSDNFLLTAEAIALTLLIAVPIPALALVLGWQLSTSLASDDFTRAVGSGIFSAALVWLHLEVLRQVLRPRGLAHSHFRWPLKSVESLNRNLIWLMAILLPLYVVSVTLHSQPNELWAKSLGRLAFIARAFVLVTFFWRVLRPSGDVIQPFLQRSRGGWVRKLRHVWYPVLVLLPVVLAIISALGYHYTAQRLERRGEITALLVVGLILINALVFRWLFVVRRRLAIERARQRQEAQREAEQRPTPPEGGEPARKAEDKEASLYAMSQDTRKLVRSLLLLGLVIGFWFIWSDVLPALGVLKRIELWSTRVSLTEVVKTPEGAEVPQKVERLQPISLAACLLAIGIVALTLIAARHLPGFLEIVLLQRLPLDRGVRFAITTISRYIITIVGFVIAFGRIGIGWGKVQWLAAAMTVGLGFGLQEIFANFVSGIIILFEQPMRVGDIVTVGDTSGTVSRIRIRATTIMDWDRKELIVPNREFITGRLVNWSLSDTTLRLIVPVGVAYGSDTALAERTLLKVARDQPNVLSDPAPYVLFNSFGDSSLVFELRVYIPSMEYYIATIHQLHLQIDQAFREADIEISFPQRDIHVRSVEVPFTITQTHPDQEPPPQSQ